MSGVNLKARVDISGLRFGKLVAMEAVGSNAKTKSVLWLCRCDCGNTTTVPANKLRANRTKSCGCLVQELQRKRLTKHGGHGTPTYRSWLTMIQRCTNPNNDNYAQYGGLGVSVCNRWLSYEQFLADMGERPEGKTLDRISVTGNYEPSNCRWETPLEQNRNRRKRTTTFAEAEQVRALYAQTRSPMAIAKALGLRIGSVKGIVYSGQITEPDRAKP